MTLYILDTDHVSLFQRGNPKIISKISQISSDNLGITIITVEEILRGRLNTIRKNLSTEKLIFSYQQLKLTIDYFYSVNIFDFTPLSLEIYTDLKKQKIRVGTQDLKIGAIALSLGGIIITRNKKDFEKIPNLIIEDWTI